MTQARTLSSLGPVKTGFIIKAGSIKLWPPMSNKLPPTNETSLTE